METGINKSLFTLIAVVIFGIFLSLSYWMFQDELKSVLGSVIDNTSEKTSMKIAEEFLVPTDSKYFSFDSNSGTITYFDISAGKDIIIPEFINGVKVTSIGPKAFSDIQLNSVYLPDTITFLGNESFWNCGLKEIRLSNNLEVISSSALAWNKLTELELPESLTILGSGSLRGNYLTTIRVPEGVTTLNDSVFSHNRFTSIELPKSFENTAIINKFIDYIFKR
jgi:hypothetical protein